jgi:uncharacterized protein (DUF433 family)
MFDHRTFDGAYAVPDVALYLRATTPPVGVVLPQWRRSRDNFIKPTSRQLYGWIKRGFGGEQYAAVPARRRAITFAELVRLRLITIMRTRGVPLAEILRAEAWARRETGSPQPFVTEPVWTYSTGVFVALAEMLVDASRGGQLALDFLRDYMRPVNHGLEFDAGGKATLWRPADGVLMAAGLAFGAPCIEGTRVQTEVLWELHQAGDSIDELARLYQIGKHQVQSAIRWEQILARAA